MKLLDSKHIKLFGLILYSIILFFSICSQFIGGEKIGEVLLIICVMMIVILPLSYFVSNNLLRSALRNNDKKKFIWIILIGIIVLPALCVLTIYLFQFMETMQMLGDSTMISDYLATSRIQYLKIVLSSVQTIVVFCSFSFLSEYNLLSSERKELEIKNINTQKAYLEEQLKSLKSQINPHSMFNILNHIHILMEENVELASKLLMNFSEILRYQLYECNNQFVSLKKEIKYLKDYISVEQIRWGDNVVFEYSERITNNTIEINPLLFIPFVENAFKFVGKESSKKGIIRINLTQTDNTLSFNIENTIGAKNRVIATNTGGIGIENVRKRLDILYNGSYTLNIENYHNLYKVNLLINIS